MPSSCEGRLRPSSGDPYPGKTGLLLPFPSLCSAHAFGYVREKRRDEALKKRSLCAWKGGEAVMSSQEWERVSRVLDYILAQKKEVKPIARTKVKRSKPTKKVEQLRLI